MKYQVTITETLEKVVTVEAASPEEAEEKVQTKWEDADFVLGAEEFTGVEFKAVPLGMTDTVREQILSVRDTGRTNMFDLNAVQVIANEMGYFDLVVYIEEHRSEYAHFILTDEAE